GVDAEAESRARVLLRRRLVHGRRGARRPARARAGRLHRTRGPSTRGRPADDALTRAARTCGARAATRVRARVLPRLRPARTDSEARARHVAARARAQALAARSQRGFR